MRAELEERGAARRSRERPATGSRWPARPRRSRRSTSGSSPTTASACTATACTLDACERILAQLAALPLESGGACPGLHPDRAPTIVAGGLILVETMALFGLDSIEVSERDILEGAALEAAEGIEGPKLPGIPPETPKIAGNMG